VSQGKKIARQQGNFWEVEHNNKKVDSVDEKMV
jgi:hypothetical protein